MLFFNSPIEESGQTSCFDDKGKDNRASSSIKSRTFIFPSANDNFHRVFITERFFHFIGLFFGFCNQNRRFGIDVEHER